ncbi:hypothetical protein KAK06_03165 [Ideonella sp. 4Y11]|uniref:Sulfotransferase family protein n=1 Tax=Ideonella aquatica TaxID=2824119 RepID=A0A940YD34_9BURK|nr:hypothetical protein [Ideonella aquatica]MBQ0957950.1 hypothetical protein [Ideonella aquatica]
MNALREPLSRPGVRSTGLLVVSSPKSGTMFLTRCLERASGLHAVFGIEHPGPAELLAQLQASGWHPRVQELLSADSPSHRLLAQRYGQYLARHREGGAEAPRLVADHGLRSFARFIVQPTHDDLLPPAQVMAWARARGLQVGYLQRDLKSVANSLVQFLLDGRSRLIRLDDPARVAALVCEVYAPILAEQARQWARLAPSADLHRVRFDDLRAEPGPLVERLCAAAGWLADARALSAQGERAWTYRVDQSATWQRTFTAAQVAALDSLEDSLHA